MMKRIKDPISAISLTVGIILILISVIILVVRLTTRKFNYDMAEEAILKVEEIMLSGVDMYPEERANNMMPSMEIGGLNVVGLIEVPQYNAKIIINSSWDKEKLSAMACRYTGNIYDRSLVIGVSDDNGQFDFAYIMDTGVKIYVTDMEGGRYTYIVEKMERTESADAEKLMTGDWDMTVFVKKTTVSGEYLLLRCKAK